jgi:lactoylglutathione lyase
MTQMGVRFTPGGIRIGAAGHHVAFIHPKHNDEYPIAGNGVLIELVQAPPLVIRATATTAAAVPTTIRTSGDGGGEA